MTQNNRTPYQREMDEVRLSKEKADETLRLMLEENRALRRKDAEKESRRKQVLLTRVLPALGAAAAVLVLLLTTVLRPSAYVFGAVRTVSLPVSGARDTARDYGYDAAAAQSMFPGWEIAEITDPALAVFAPDGEQSSFVIKKDGAQFTVTLSVKETALSSALHGQPAYGNAGVRLNRDADTGVLSACFQKNGQYAVLSARDMAEDSFVKAALAAAES